jgi:hypothetical protein
MLATAIHRAGREIGEIGARLRKTLAHVEIIADRIETVTGGLKGGEKPIADVLASVGHLARGLERNMKIIDVSSAILASVGTAIAAYVKTRFPADQAGEPPAPTVVQVREEEQAQSATADSPEASIQAH